MESFLSNDDTDPREIFAALKRSPADNLDSLKGTSFTGAREKKVFSSAPPKHSISQIFFEIILNIRGTANFLL